MATTRSAGRRATTSSRAARATTCSAAGGQRHRHRRSRRRSPLRRRRRGHPRRRQGKDTFHVSGDGGDLIADFEPGVDRIVIDGRGLAARPRAGFPRCGDRHRVGSHDGSAPGLHGGVVPPHPSISRRERRPVAEVPSRAAQDHLPLKHARQGLPKAEGEQKSSAWRSVPGFTFRNLTACALPSPSGSKRPCRSACRR
jgi:hypothetical protein